MTKEYVVELKTKEGFVWCHIPKIKVTATNQGEASEKALNKADKTLGLRRIAIEVINVKEIEQ